MDRTTAVSDGWITLVRELTTVLPGALATISSFPTSAQTKATRKIVMIDHITILVKGETGVSMSSRCAGRNSTSSRLRGAVS
ncbi:hypothetical protein D3C81_1618740 [compost metagenome]